MITQTKQYVEIERIVWKNVWTAFILSLISLLSFYPLFSFFIFSNNEAPNYVAIGFGVGSIVSFAVGSIIILGIIFTDYKEKIKLEVQDENQGVKKK